MTLDTVDILMLEPTLKSTTGNDNESSIIETDVISQRKYRVTISLGFTRSLSSSVLKFETCTYVL